MSWLLLKPVAWLTFLAGVAWPLLALGSMGAGLHVLVGLAVLITLAVFQFLLLSRAQLEWEAGRRAQAVALRLLQIALGMAPTGALLMLTS